MTLIRWCWLSPLRSSTVCTSSRVRSSRCSRSSTSSWVAPRTARTATACMLENSGCALRSRPLGEGDTTVPSRGLATASAGLRTMLSGLPLVRLRAWWERAFWVIPVFGVLVGWGLDSVSVGVDEWAFGAGGLGSFISPAASITLLAAIGGGMVTFTGFVFSVMLLMLQYGSSEYSPRTASYFMRTRTTQRVLALFLATIVFSFLSIPRGRLSGSRRLRADGQCGDRGHPAVPEPSWVPRAAQCHRQPDPCRRGARQHRPTRPRRSGCSLRSFPCPLGHHSRTNARRSEGRPARPVQRTPRTDRGRRHPSAHPNRAPFRQPDHPHDPHRRRRVGGVAPGAGQLGGRCPRAGISADACSWTTNAPCGSTRSTRCGS